MKARAAGVAVDPNGRNDFWDISSNINGEYPDEQWRTAVLDDW